MDIWRELLVPNQKFQKIEILQLNCTNDIAMLFENEGGEGQKSQKIANVFNGWSFIVQSFDGHLKRIVGPESKVPKIEILQLNCTDDMTMLFENEGEGR